MSSQPIKQSVKMFKKANSYSVRWLPQIRLFLLFYNINVTCRNVLQDHGIAGVFFSWVTAIKNTQCRWFSPGTPASSTSKTDRSMTEILVKVALNPNQTNKIELLYVCQLSNYRSSTMHLIHTRKQAVKGQKIKLVLLIKDFFINKCPLMFNKFQFLMKTTTTTELQIRHLKSVF